MLRRVFKILLCMVVALNVTMVNLPAFGAFCPGSIQFVYYNTCDSSTMDDSWCADLGEVGIFKENTTFTCGDKTFIGWNTQEDGKGQTYQPGETVPANLTKIYAQWLAGSPVVNVKYIHDAILAKWNVSVGYNSALTNKSVAANMKYLLAAIDVANKKIGGSSKVYSGTSYATSYAVNKQTADNAIKNLIKKPRTFPFTATTSSTSSFSFNISAAGEFWVDWGDGSDVQVITKASTGSQTISHTYATAAAYDVRLGGLATAYPTSIYTAAISFESTSYLTGISGSLGAIFPTLANGSQPRFYRAFYGRSTLTGSIPENLFAGISGAPVSNMFNGTFVGCSRLTGSIPENLFAGIKGAPVSNMFKYTFYGCTNLTGSVPEKLFAGVSGAPASDMFNSTFYGCTGLTSIPENLFAGISGTPASNMFNSTFYGCTGLTSIPENLFAGISGAPASDMFNSTFYGCTGLMGSIPENLFAGILGAPAVNMFYNTFYNCRGLTSIPENLFAGISGTPASNMFNSTFYGCTGLTSIPENLFAGISGAPATSMFNSTFYNCRGLTSIPENLFAGISGTPANNMFYDTFRGCSGLTGEIPLGLFGNLSGTPASRMFCNTFWGCSGLTGEIPLGLFGNLSGTPAGNMFSNTFNSCKGLYGKSARNPDGTYLYDVFPSATSTHVSDMYTGTCLEDNASIPSTWGGKACTYVEPEPEYPFELTTTSDTSSFSFNISAAGTFYVNWGDGSAFQKIEKTDTTQQTISHTYTTAGAYAVRIGGRATGYASSYNESNAAISFKNNKNLAKISGSLGEIFPTVNGRRPIFRSTFYGCTNLTGSIPEKLFSGISGAPVVYMFASTFRGSSGLTGSIPSGLFGNISGAPAAYMFDGTFNGCTGLTGEIPSGLFGELSGAPAASMFGGTFRSCSGLTGSIPSGLFGNITGAPATYMFDATFNGCSGLTGEIPSGLFGELSGAPAYSMFGGTFRGCSGLTGEIPLGLFGNLSGTLQNNMFTHTFNGCSGLTGKSARSPDGTYLYNAFSSATSLQVGNMYTGTCLYDNASIPSEWGGKACTYTGPIPPDEVTDFPFSVTTVPNTSSMDIMLNAWGNFTIDWGDGNRESISRTTANTNEQIFSHTYASAGTYEIKFAGTPTGYPSRLASASSGEPHFDPTAIQFRDPYNTSSKCNIASVSGKLGALFPTLTSALTGSGVQPVFDSTFSECAQLTEIPAGLFDGITGAPAEGMFNSTFFGTRITEIPAGLFDGISGNAEQMAFAYTFAECTNLTSIPQGLFDGITVDANPGYGAFAGTFYGCTNLTGPSAQMSDGTYLYELDGFDDGVGKSMYQYDEGLDDYSTMPTYLKE